MSVFSLQEGTSPLIISIPHAGILIPDAIKARMTGAALLLPDTDWYMPLLYDFAVGMGATIITAHYSRYVIDVNRPPDNAPLYPGQAKVALCPDKTFEGVQIYKPGENPHGDEETRRLHHYWNPYHDALRQQVERVKQHHGYVILYDAHSIKGDLPRLFEGRLPDINLGTASGESCAAGMEQAAYQSVLKYPDFSSVLNGRFIGGYITRHYGDPENHVHALQMELVRENYMDEDSFTYAEHRAEKLKPVLRDVLQSVLDWGASTYNPPRTTA